MFRNGRYLNTLRKYAEYLTEDLAVRRSQELLAIFDYTEVRVKNWQNRVKYEVWVGNFMKEVITV